MRIIFLLLLSLSVISGCSSHIRKDVPSNLPLKWSYETDLSDHSISFGLLKIIKNSKVTDLVKEALSNNNDIKATYLRLKAAGFMVKGSRSVFLPTADLTLSRGHNNLNVDSDSGKRVKKNQYRGSLNVSWEIDLWGKLKDRYNSEQKEFYIQKEDYIQARDLLAVKVIQAYIDITSAKRAVLIEKKRFETLKRNDSLLLSRYKKGIGSLHEHSASKSRKEYAKATLSGRIEEYRRSVRILEILLGRFPDNLFKSEDKLPEISPPPVFIPLEVLRRRPDIKAAIARIEAGNLKALASKKGFLPSVQISSDMIKESFKKGSFNTATLLWNVVFNMIQPVFRGGSVYYSKKAREFERDAAVIDLSQKVLVAVKEVQDALGYEKDYNIQLKAMEKAVKEAEKSRIYFEDRYRKGLCSVRSLLTAQEEEMNLRIQLNNVKTSLLKNRLQLALAAGITLKSNAGLLK